MRKAAFHHAAFSCPDLCEPLFYKVENDIAERFNPDVKTAVVDKEIRRMVRRYRFRVAALWHTADKKEERRSFLAVERKILGTGDLARKLTIQGAKVSAAAREKIEKAGGSIA